MPKWKERNQHKNTALWRCFCTNRANRYPTRKPIPTSKAKRSDLIKVSFSLGENKIAKADKAYKNWKDKPVKERSALLLKVADLLQQKKKELYFGVPHTLPPGQRYGLF